MLNSLAQLDAVLPDGGYAGKWIGGADRASSDHWHLVYEDFDPLLEGTREALCTLGNGYWATRGSVPGTTADGVSVRLQHDAAGNVVATGNGLGATSRTEPHVSGLALGLTLPDGARYEFERDDAGRLLALRTPLGQEYTLHWTPAGRLAGLVTMEDLHISQPGQGWKDVLDGFYDADGKIPCQIDGGLKCFGHPIGASGLRMLYEMYLQFQGRAGARQLKDPRIGMTHNLGGAPRENVSSVAIVGRFE